MDKMDRFFRAMAWLCFGALLGILIAPVKNGFHLSICSNNVGTSFGEDGKVVSTVDAEDVSDVTEEMENADAAAEQDDYREDDEV